MTKHAVRGREVRSCGQFEEDGNTKFEDAKSTGVHRPHTQFGDTWVHERAERRDPHATQAHEFHGRVSEKQLRAHRKRIRGVIKEEAKTEVARDEQTQVAESKI